ncbi:MAG: ParA family protein [Chthonomonadales bacterium]|nr:ParA family protein [Chthonomonadales bacterium]
MGIVYAVVNQKGGVGKTTTAVSVAASLALAGQRVLVVDLDPQGNATSGLGVDKNAVGAGNGATSSIYDVLIDDAPIGSAIARTPVTGLDLVPTNLDLAGAEIELMPRLSRENCLRRALAPVRDGFDFVLIDTPPSLGLLTVNALVAADSGLVPIQCEYYALEGVSQLLKTVDLVRRHLNPTFAVRLVVLTMYDSRARLSQQVVAEVRQAFGDRVSPTLVPRNVRLSEAPSHGLPIALYDSRSRGARAYRAIAEEMLRDGKAWAGEGA